ncbi:MAG: hypothetical protein K6G55_06525, partial [Selenomonadaceae bacterium]|nr:hypothetical protein [Selenomonadaceae bacterium]
MFTVSKTVKRLKKIAVLTAFATAFFAIGAIDSPVTYGAKSTVIKAEKTWKGETVEHKGFKDLGNYVIELPDFTDPSTEKKGLAAFNALVDNGKIPKFGCTAMVKKNSRGEVVMGRNMDLDISQSAAYVFKTTYGKYKNFCVSYLPKFYMSYADLQKIDELDEEAQSVLLFCTSDCMNEKGLYIEMNQREKTDRLTCYGMHSSRGETTRDDGIPWSELRACQTSIPMLASQNCATVDEVVEFLKNSYDWYTIGLTPFGVDTNNTCFLVGDATGEYGLIELAEDEIN